MNKRTLGIVAVAILGGLSLGGGSASAAPLAVPAARPTTRLQRRCR